MNATRNLAEDPVGLPAHLIETTPVPTWEQVTRADSSSHEQMLDHVTRILGETGNAKDEREAWNLFPDCGRRSIALLIDKIYNEGWLDAVGRISGWPWDGGFFFEPIDTNRGTLAEVLDSNSHSRGSYTACNASKGLFAYLSARNHPGWRRSWMENDTATAALHIGVFESGVAEVHFDAFNPLFTNGAPPSDLVRVPLVGSYNRRLFNLHRRWEHGKRVSAVRTSAYLYHLLAREGVPLSF
ncbi:MAG TPA: hypothetical protein VNS63_09005 [Blastocatellia bacterium]|nr:hypothetical protein [Blastocatellia bacterium]